MSKIWVRGLSGSYCLTEYIYIAYRHMGNSNPWGFQVCAHFLDDNEVVLSEWHESKEEAQEWLDNFMSSKLQPGWEIRA